MADLSTTWSTSHRPVAAEFKRYAYLSNGWNPMRRWDGRTSTLEAAGIAGPSQDADSWTPAPTTAAGNTTVGAHVFRYRYLDSRTGYISDPSEERTILVASGAEALTFPISTSGAANIIRSSDSKVDRVVVEMTTVEGGAFYKVAEVAQDDSNVVANLSDELLVQNTLVWPADGHNVPPIGSVVVSHRERLWVFGQVEHSTGTADFTNGSADVDEGSTDPDWSADALGDSTASPVKLSSVAWLIRKVGDSAVYEVDHYDESANKIVLVENYAGTTETNAAYTLFSRANVIWVSRAGYPESFTPLGFLNGPNGEGAGHLKAGIGYLASMVFFSASGMWRVIWDRDPLIDPQIHTLGTQRGALSQRVVVEVEGNVYAFDRLGFHRFSGVSPANLGKPVDELLSLIDFSQAENFHACYFPRLRAIRWHVVYTSDGGSYPKRYLQLDLDTGNWSTGEFQVGISESRLAQSSEGLVVYYGDENGHIWIADNGTCDGCNSDYSHLKIRGAGATTTLLPVDTSDRALPTAGAGLAGCVAYWLEGGERRIVSSNTSSSLTVSSAFSSAPGDGDTIWLGTIPAKLKTKAFSASGRGMGPQSKLRPRLLHLMFEPTGSARHVRVRVYHDLSETAEAAWTSHERSNPQGVVLPGQFSPVWQLTPPEPSSGYTDFLVDTHKTDGYVAVPVGGDFKRFVEAEIEVDEPDTPVQLYSLVLDGESVETHK